MLKLYNGGANFIIRNSLLHIRYSFRVHGKIIVLKSPTSKELAMHLRLSVSHSSEILE
jgi:hypothetical protein